MAGVLARVFSRIGLHRSKSLCVVCVHSKYEQLREIKLNKLAAQLPGISEFTDGVWCISRRCLSGNSHWEDGMRHQVHNYDDEEAMYDVNEDNIDTLRKRHREETKSEHVATEKVTFSHFPIDSDLLNKLDQLGYKEPFEIQSKTLLPTLSGKDVIGKAVTGSGKTLAFCIPILHKLSQSSPKRYDGRTKSPRAIVISPTRELCLQLHRTFQELSDTVKCVALYGGASFYRQENEMRRGVDVICATPGRLNDHLQRGTINLDQVCFLCLDEADELLTPNFKDQIENVLQGSHADKQMMLFSATMPDNIRSIVRNYMNNPVHVDITHQKLTTPSLVKHLCMKVASSQHVAVIRHLLTEYNSDRCIVFTETKLKAREVAHTLRSKMSLQAEGLHSDLSQSRRENIMAAFREGQIKILVATDVAARGLDVPEVSLIIQAGPPRNGSDYYIHRAGRTGRGGREGHAILLHSGSRADLDVIEQIERSVTLEHVALTNSAELQAQFVRSLIASLKGMSVKRCTPIASILNEMQLTSEQSEHILCAAISSLLTSDSQTDSEMNRQFTGRRQSNTHGSQGRYNAQKWAYGQKKYGDNMHYDRNSRYTKKFKGANARGNYGREESMQQPDDEYDDDFDISAMHDRFKTSRTLY